MTTPATEAAEAAEASAEAAEAAAEAAEAEAKTEETEAGGDDGGDDTTVVVVDDGGDEGAQDDATQLDHEQRITRLEERHAQLAEDIGNRPDYETVRSMIPDTSMVVEQAREAAAAVAEATAEAVDEAEETGEPASVRIEEPPSTAGDIVTVSPEVPAAAEESGRRRSSLFRW